MSDKLSNQLFELKCKAKELTNSATKCAMEQAAAKLKVKKAIEKGDMDGAKIHAQTAIRKKTEELNFMQLSSRLDATVSKLQSQAQMQGVASSFAGIVGTLNTTMQTFSPTDTAVTMGKFQQMSDSQDMNSHVMNEVMGTQAGMSTPQSQVDSLMSQVAEQYSLQLSAEMPNAKRTPMDAGMQAPMTHKPSTPGF